VERTSFRLVFASAYRAATKGSGRLLYATLAFLAIVSVGCIQNGLEPSLDSDLTKPAELTKSLADQTSLLSLTTTRTARWASGRDTVEACSFNRCKLTFA
jgi:hypothetical protein